MFKKLFNRRKKKQKADNPKYSGEEDANLNSLPGNANSPKVKKTSPKTNVRREEIPRFSDTNEEIPAYKPRKKKGKKPKFKKIIREKPERNIGIVMRVKNNFYPGDVDFKYTAPRTNWVACLGRPLKESDFGLQVRILPEVTDLL